MNPFRAKKIADHFAVVGIFTVKRKIYGVNVHFRGVRSYFEDEPALWRFLFYISHAQHCENIITEAELKLTA
ncbi:MAG: hypothetical protein Q9M21_06345 [Mariprofundaceae bacterium]|nr:hypothetical protein [Mariprofundaceae bacterium]